MKPKPDDKAGRPRRRRAARTTAGGGAPAPARPVLPPVTWNDPEWSADGPADDDDGDPVVRHLLPPGGYGVDPAAWRARLADLREGMGCDWLHWFLGGPASKGAVVVGAAIVDLARRLDAVTAERDALLATGRPGPEGG